MVPVTAGAAPLLEPLELAPEFVLPLDPEPLDVEPELPVEPELEPLLDPLELEPELVLPLDPEPLDVEPELPVDPESEPLPEPVLPVDPESDPEPLELDPELPLLEPVLEPELELLPDAGVPASDAPELAWVVAGDPAFVAMPPHPERKAETLTERKVASPSAASRETALRETALRLREESTRGWREGEKEKTKDMRSTSLAKGNRLILLLSGLV